MHLLYDAVRSRSVALVGNSRQILRERPARQIDSADIVIRINRGLPTKIDSEAIGVRTSFWATAKAWPDLIPPSDCAAILWMKLTEMGQKHLEWMRKQHWVTPIEEWPSELEQQCREFVGADPGTGIRLLWYLRTQASPRSVSCYGMDCWQHPTHWSGRKNTPNHSPELERIAMLKLL